MSTGKPFSLWEPAELRRVSSKGGKKAQRMKLAHAWTAKEAAEAGRKGGLVAAARRKIKREEEAQRRAEVEVYP